VGQGCQSTRYPAFQTEKKNISEASLVMDVFTYDDIQGDTDRVNLQLNRTYCDIVRREIPKMLQKKGYTLSKIYSPQIGNYAQKKVYRVAEKSVNKDQLEDMPVLEPPYPIDSTTVSPDEETILVIGKFMRRSSTEEEKDVKSTVATKGSINAIFFVLVRGKEVSAGQQVGSALLTGLVSGLLSGGTYIHSQWEADYTSIDVAVIDRETGKVLYEKSVSDKSWGVGTLNDLIVGLHEKFPSVNGIEE
jgi:hypothetical protein